MVWLGLRRLYIFNFDFNVVIAMKWLKLISVIPLICFLVITNIYQDPANIFHNDSASIADAILSGNEAYFGSGNGDERAVKQSLIEGMSKDVDCLTMGPSLSMGIRRTNVGTDSYYNLSASGLNFYDFLAEFGLMEIYDINVDRIVFCVDSYFFDENFYSAGSRNPDMMKYADYMIAILNNEECSVPEKVSDEQMRLMIEQAFSITYFQSSVKFIQSNNSYIIPNKRWGIVDETTEDLAHYKSDASWVYAIEYRRATENDVLRHAAGYNINAQFSKGGHISEYSKDIFIKLIEHLRNKGVEIEFFLCPLAPALWDRIENDVDSDQFFILDELEEFATETAKEYGIKITGSYNPYQVGISNADFWDSRHIRHDNLDNFFDFKE